MTKIEIPHEWLEAGKQEYKALVRQWLTQVNYHELVKKSDRELCRVIRNVYKVATEVGMEVPTVWVGLKHTLLREGRAFLRVGELYSIKERSECPHCGKHLE